jgi:3-oxoacyl-[acyl-carrier protein] reductase
VKLLEGKTALITGATRGIGKGIALKFASEGANIAFTGRGANEDMLAALEATRQEVEALGVKCIAYASDAANFAQTEETVKKVKEDFGSIDILVNNAGITKDGLMLRMTEERWDTVINANLKSAFNLHLRKHFRGVLFVYSKNISDRKAGKSIKHVEFTRHRDGVWKRLILA